MNDLISVIIPTYNRAHLLSNAIQSVLQQTYPHWELIIVDDGSTDTTKEVVENFIARDSRIRYFYKENGGQAEARNFGIERSTGDFIAFLDSDDIYLGKNLEKKLEILKKNPSCLIVNGRSWIIEQESCTFVDCTSYSPSNWLVRIDFLKLGGFFDSFQRNVEDTGIRMRAFLNKGTNIEIFLSDPQVLYFQHKDQVSNSRILNPTIFIPRLQSLLRDFTGNNVVQLKKFNSEFNARLGNFYCLDGDFKKGRFYFVKSLTISFNLFSIFFLFVSNFYNRFLYSNIEQLMRSFQRNFVWRGRLFFTRFCFSGSYLEAQKVLHHEIFNF